MLFSIEMLAKRWSNNISEQWSSYSSAITRDKAQQILLITPSSLVEPAATTQSLAKQWCLAATIKDALPCAPIWVVHKQQRHIS